MKRKRNVFTVKEDAVKDLAVYNLPRTHRENAFVSRNCISLFRDKGKGKGAVFVTSNRSVPALSPKRKGEHRHDFYVGQLDDNINLCPVIAVAWQC